MSDGEFKDLRIVGAQVHSRHGDGGPVAGAVARIESGSDLYRRMLTGDGPAAPTTDRTPFYLSIEAPGWSLIRQCAPSDLAEAQSFADHVTRAGAPQRSFAVGA